MTVSSETTKVVLPGDGSNYVFNYDFYIPDAASVEVIYTDVDGNNEVLTNTQYSITGLGAAAGGTVTYPLTGSAIASGTYLTIARNMPLIQPYTIANQGNFYPAAVDAALDWLTYLIQDVNETFSRALVAPVTDPDAPLPLPGAQERANQLLGFDSAGNPIASQPSSALVSTAMQPVVSAATLALARAAMGLGTISTENIGKGLQDDGSGNLNVLFPPTTVNTTQTLTAANHLTQYIAIGPITFNLPLTSAVFAGFGFFISAFSGIITLTPNVSDAFRGQASGASIGIPANWSGYVYTDGSGNWYTSVANNNLPMQSPQSSGSFSKLVITNNAGTPNTKIDVSADVIVLSKPGSQVRLSSPSFTIDGSLSGVVNGLDTGILQASTWYYVYAIAGVSLTGTVSSGGLISTSATAPSLPSGYTYSKRIGAFRTDASIHFYRVIQRGNRSQYIVGTNPSAALVMAAGTAGTYSATAPVWVAVPIGTFVPPTSISIRFWLLGVRGGGAASNMIAAPNNSYAGPSNASGNAPPAWSLGGMMICDFILESTNIYWASSAAGGAVLCQGWEDNL